LKPLFRGPRLPGGAFDAGFLHPGDVPVQQNGSVGPKDLVGDVDPLLPLLDGGQRAAMA
jgi:hypothetical protein